MEWLHLVVLLLAAFRITSQRFSGDGSGSGMEWHENEKPRNQVQETTVHEITDSTFSDASKYQTEIGDTLLAATTSHLCEFEGNCSVTETPLPTQVLSLNVDEENLENRKETSIKNIESMLKKYENGQTDFLKNITMMENQIEKTLTVISEKFDVIEKDQMGENLAAKVENRFSDRLQKLEDGIQRIFEVLTTLSQSRSYSFEAKTPTDATTTAPIMPMTNQQLQERFDLVATETWSYIDSKFTELKKKLLDANERMKRDLEDKMREVLEKYEPKGDNTHKPESGHEGASQSIEEDDMKVTIKKSNIEKVKDSTVQFCTQCCTKIPAKKAINIEHLRKKTKNIDGFDQDWHKNMENDNDPVIFQPMEGFEKGDRESYSTARLARTSWATTIAPVRQTGQSETVATEIESNEDSILQQIPKNSPSILHIINKYYQQQHSNYENEETPDEENVKRSVKGLPIFVQEQNDHTVTAETFSIKHDAPETFKTDYPKNCAEIYLNGDTRSGVRRVSPGKHASWEVYCDMETEGGGWTVIQRRTFGNVNFSRDWEDYKNGFGSITGDFWLGLDKMHILTANYGHEDEMSLRIDLKDWADVAQFARYGSFKISSEKHNYKLHLKDYHGTAGNALQYGPGGSYNNNHQSFTTFDRDNDGYRDGNCGAYYGSGWWFNSCFAANLNGKYYRGTYTGIRNGIYWGTWYRLSDAQTNSRHSFKYVDMKVRPQNFPHNSFTQQ